MVANRRRAKDAFKVSSTPVLAGQLVYRENACIVAKPEVTEVWLHYPLQSQCTKNGVLRNYEFPEHAFGADDAFETLARHLISGGMALYRVAA